MMRVALLWLLQSLFALRVLGQIFVGIYAPGWLPDWKEWYSGLLPYPILLPIQFVLLGWMTIVTSDNGRGTGRFCVETYLARRRLRVIAAIYAGAMLLRYALTMILVPEMRWLHGTIAIAFHLALAAYIAILAVPDERRRSTA